MKYIYLITKLDNTPIKAYTKKYWAEHFIRENPKQYKIYRCRDGLNEHNFELYESIYYVEES